MGISSTNSNARSILGLFPFIAPRVGSSVSVYLAPFSSIFRVDARPLRQKVLREKNLFPTSLCVYDDVTCICICISVFINTFDDVTGICIDWLGIFKCKVYYRSLSLYCPRLGFSLSVYLAPFSSIFRSDEGPLT